MADAVPIGTRLGKYRITGPLGQGGMAVVYAGEDTRLKRPVAIKILPRAVAREPGSLQRFLLEARAAARLNHPNVVAVHDIGQRGGVCYIVMELACGGSAHARVRGREPLPWPEATRIISDVCRGLAAAHRAGLIHRDIKPGNVLLAADGTAKLADFGLARAPALLSSRLTQVGTVLGTPQYMSPEQCTGERLDERTDLYALGATYYTLLAGRPPFDGDDEVKILYAHCSAPAPDPRAAVPSLPAGCAAIVAKAMAKARGERFQSAAEMLAALTALMPAVAVPVSPRHESTAPPAPAAVPAPVVAAAKPRRWRVAPVLGGLVSVITLGAWVVAAVLSRPPGDAVSSPRPAEGTAPAAFGPRIVLRPRAPLTDRHKGEVTAVSIAAGLLASAGADGHVHVSRPDGGDPHVMHYPVKLTATALTPDGKLLAAGGESSSVFLWDVEKKEGLPSLGGFPSNVLALAFSPAGTELAVATETSLDLCDGRPPTTLRRRRLLQRQYMVSSVAFSADGKRLAACTYDKAVYVWDLSSLNKWTATGKLPTDLGAVALAPDGSRAAFASRNTGLYLWEPDSGRPARLADNQPGLGPLAFAPGGRTLVSGGVWGGPLRVRDLTDGTTALAPALPDGKVHALGFDPDGKLLAAACSDGAVRLWDVEPDR